MAESLINGLNAGAAMGEHSSLANLMTIAGVCVFGERQAPLPKDLRDQLAAEAEAAFDHVLAERLDARASDDEEMAEDLLIHAAFAAVAYPYLQMPLAALKAAHDLVTLLTAPLPSAPQSWQEKAGIVG